MILIAKGQILLRKVPVLELGPNQKCLAKKGSAFTRNALVINAKAVVMRAMKHPKIISYLVQILDYS